MQQKLLIYHIILSVLILQPLTVSAVTVADLKDYYANVNRGAKCFFQGKKCTAQEQRAWRIGSAGIILALITLLGYTQKGRIAYLFNTSGPSQEQMVQLYTAVKNGDVDQVRKLANNPQGLDIKFGNESLPAKAASYVLGQPEDPKRLEIFEIILKSKAPDYNNSLNNYLIKFNGNVAKMTAEEKIRYKTTLDTLEKVNALWAKYKK